jgi:hypothetical protein
MNITHLEARSGVALRCALKLSALGVFAATGLACSSFANPATTTPNVGGSSSSAGASSSNGGATNTAGATDTGISGSFTSGGGGATGIAGDTSISGSTGTAGAGVIPPTAPFCNDPAAPVAQSPLPYTVTTGFIPSGYQGDGNFTTEIKADTCATRAPGMIGSCFGFTYTPDPTTPTWAGVSFVRQWDSNYTHPPVCVAAGATSVTFMAKGAVGGENVTFSAATAMEQSFVLTAAWAQYSISLSGVSYNTDATGLESGFFWKVAPPVTGAVAETFYVDDIQFVSSTGSGGAGGAGGTGGTGGGAGGSGGASGSAGASGAGGSGGAAAGSGGSGGA